MSINKKDNVQEGPIGAAFGAVGGTLTTAMPYVAVTSLLITAFKLGKEYMTKASRACIDLSGVDKALCKTQINLEGYKRALVALKSARGKCGKTKNPDKCIKTINKHIMKTQIKIDKLSTRNDSYKKIKMISDREKRLAKMGI